MIRNRNPQTIAWIRVLQRLFKGTRNMKQAIGLMGPQWSNIKEVAQVADYPALMQTISSALGFDARALIPDFLAEAAAIEETNRNRLVAKRLSKEKKQPYYQQAIDRLRKEARLRPRRYR
jgi:glucokinase